MPAEIHISESRHNQGPSKNILPNSGHGVVNYISSICYRISDFFVYLVSLWRIPAMPTALTTTYLVPAILFNPAVILHVFNTFMSRVNPGELAVSVSPREWLEKLGPADPTSPYLDMNSSEPLCWSYTIVMVLVQILAFGKVSGNRIQKKAARAAKKERREKERLDRMAMEEQRVSVQDVEMERQYQNGLDVSHDANGQRRRSFISGHRVTESNVLATLNGKITIHDSDDMLSETSTSDEETIV